MHDYVEVVESLKANISCIDCKVVAIGQSYGAMLAAWMRMKYPHTFDGAISSSSLLQSMGYEPQPQLRVALLTQIYAKYDPKLPKLIKEAFNRMDLGLTDETRRA
jgi:alpha-beta hydrolase superfamily lysophospholipase